MTDEHDEQIIERLGRAFAAEVAAAEHQLGSRRITRRPRSATFWVAVAGLVIVLVLTGGFALQSLRLGPWPSVGSAPSPGSRAGGEDLPPAMPRAIGGLDVAPVPAAISMLDEAEDATPLLVGGWLEPFEGYCTDDLLTGCKSRVTTSASSIAPALWVAFEQGPAPTRGWAVLRVHTRDRRAARCTAELRSTCEDVVVVEAVPWSLPDPSIAVPPVSPSPRPTDQAGASSPPTSAEPSPTTHVPSPTMTSPPGLALPTSAPGAGGSDALWLGHLGGTVVDDRVCLWVERTDIRGDRVRRALIWPSGFRALDAPLRLIGPDDQTLARVGDAVELGGGGPPVGYVPTSRQDPCRIGEIFAVSVVERVNGTLLRIGAGSLRIMTRQPGEPSSCGPAFLDPAMLVMSDGRLRLRMNGADKDVTWPSGFKASSVDDTRITIVDGDGVVVMRQGDDSSSVRGSIVDDRIDVCGFGRIGYR